MVGTRAQVERLGLGRGKVNNKKDPISAPK